MGLEKVLVSYNRKSLYSGLNTDSPKRHKMPFRDLNQQDRQPVLQVLIGNDEINQAAKDHY